MKKYLLSLAIPALALFMGSCSKDTEGTTWITYYPQINISGEIYMNWEAGVPFQDPGVTVIMNEEDVTDQMVVTTDMDLSNPKPGFYTINYGFTNPEGIVASGSRYVAVVSADAPLAGYYSTSNASTVNGKAFVGSRFIPVSLEAVDGGYEVSDLLGGYYEYVAGYGYRYALSAVVNVDASGAMTLVTEHPICPGWATTAMGGFGPGSYDAATKTFHWNVKYPSTPYEIYITKL